MRIFFYAPLKPINSPIPSGDREIARSLHDFLQRQGHEVHQLSGFRTKYFWTHPLKLFAAAVHFVAAFCKCCWHRPDAFFTYHIYYKAPDPLAPFLARIFRRPHYIFEAMYGDRPRENWRTWPGWWLTRFALARAEQIFCAKSEDLEGLTRVVAREQIHYIPPSLDLATFQRRGWSAQTLPR